MNTVISFTVERKTDSEVFKDKLKIWDIRVKVFRMSDNVQTASNSKTEKGNWNFKKV